MLGSLLLGGASALGSFFGQRETNAQNRELFWDQLTFNQNEAQKQRDYETQMANTAHQREAADLEAAGLNRILTADGGPGAVTPSGATAAASSAPQMQNPFAAFQPFVATALEAARVQNETKKIDSDIDKQQFEKKYLGAQTDESTARKLESEMRTRRGDPEADFFKELMKPGVNMMRKFNETIQPSPKRKGPFDVDPPEKMDEGDETWYKRKWEQQNKRPFPIQRKG